MDARSIIKSAVTYAFEKAGTIEGVTLRTPDALVIRIWEDGSVENLGMIDESTMPLYDGPVGLGQAKRSAMQWIS